MDFKPSIPSLTSQMCRYVKILPIYIHIYISGKFYPFYLHSQRTFTTLYFEIYVKYIKYIQNQLLFSKIG